jgi:hypothetical protein
MEAPIRGVDPLRILQGVAERQARGRKGNGEAFQRELGEEPGKNRGGERPVPPPLQRQGPGIRKDPQDGSVHVDLLA